MRVLVLVKQVPGTSEVSIDPETGTLRREGVPVKTNPYDLHALEAALQIRDGARASAAAPGAGVCGEAASAGEPVTVTVLSMGPPQAEAVIRESYWMGADGGVLLTDRAFAGADTLATAFALSQAARKVGFDLIVAGMQSTDGDTAQVGPGVAEFLGIPHVSCVRSIERVSPEGMEVTADLGDRHLTQEISFPCLITVTRDLNQPRLPSFRVRKETAGWTVAVVKPGDLPPSEEHHYGLAGSPTRVQRVFAPKKERVQELWEGPAEELARRMAALLTEVLGP